MVNKFLKALTYVSVPETILRYYISKMLKLNDLKEIRAILSTVLKDVFEGTCDSKNIKAMQGGMFRNIQKFKKDFGKLTGKSITRYAVKFYHIYELKFQIHR